ncbi:MAG: hypothetical protein ACC652_08450 [Acidimicrobiales bacterium]
MTSSDNHGVIPCRADFEDDSVALLVDLREAGSSELILQRPVPPGELRDDQAVSLAELRRIIQDARERTQGSGVWEADSIVANT